MNRYLSCFLAFSVLVFGNKTASSQTVTDAAAQAQSSVGFSQGFSTLTYHQLKSPSSLIYVFQATPDLIHWITPNSPVELSRVDSGDNWLVTVRDPLSLNAQKRFMRVKIDNNPPSLLYPPTSLNSTWTSDQSGVLLQWSDQTPVETGYSIERRIGAGDFQTIGIVSSDTNSFLDTLSIPQEGLHSYRVTALKDDLQSAFSSQSVLTTTLDSDGDGMPDAWEAAHGLNPSNPGDAGNASANGDGLTNLQSYLQGIDPTQPYLVTPTITSVTAGDQSATIVWQSVAGASSYTLLRREDPSHAWVTVASNLTTLSFTDQSLVNGTSYDYGLYAVNTNAQSSVSQPSSVTASSANLNLSAPGLFYAISNGDAGTVLLQWDAGTNWNSGTAAVVERFNNTTHAWNQIVSQKGSFESYLDDHLQSRKQYLYRLHFVTPTGSSPTIKAYSKSQSPPEFAVVTLANFAANSINNNGLIAGAVSNDAVSWRNGIFTQTGNLSGGTYSIGEFCDDAGRIYGQANTLIPTLEVPSNRPDHAFWWDGSMHDVGVLPRPSGDGHTTAYDATIFSHANNTRTLIVYNYADVVKTAISNSGSALSPANKTVSMILTSNSLNDIGQILIGKTISPGNFYCGQSTLSGASFANFNDSNFYANDLNNTGVAVGSTYTFDYTRRVSKQYGGSNSSAGELALDQGYYDSEAIRVNDNGVVVGYSGYRNYAVSGGEVYDLNELASSDVGTPYDVNNKQVILASSKASSSNRLLLLPYSFQEVYPSSGLDPQSSPRWLMVPLNGTNSVNAAVPGSVDMNISFNMQPSGAAESVAPLNTTTSTAYLTVTAGGAVSNDSIIRLGVGSAVATTGGLRICVKRPQTVKIAIHAITQHNGIDADLAPQTVPTITGLKQYLNQVFGPQSNTFFDVVRSDYAVNYDVDSTNPNPAFSGHKNGKLDVPGIHLPTQIGDEEQAIVNVAKDSTAFINIYYVRDFLSPVDSHGVSFQIDHITWMKDTSTPSHVNYIAAHEIGHQLGISAHANDPTVAGTLRTNPAFLPTTENQQQQRLMYGGDLPNMPTLLTKPEWDIINPFF